MYKKDLWAYGSGFLTNKHSLNQITHRGRTYSGGRGRSSGGALISIIISKSNEIYEYIKTKSKNPTPRRST